MWNKSKFCDNAKTKCKSTVVKGVSGLSIWCTSLTAKPITWFGESRFPRRYKQASMNCSRIEGKLVPTLKFCRIPSCLEPPGFCKFIFPIVPSWIYIFWCTVCEYLKAHHTTVTGLRRWKHKKRNPTGDLVCWKTTNGASCDWSAGLLNLAPASCDSVQTTSPSRFEQRNIDGCRLMYTMVKNRVC